MTGVLIVVLGAVALGLVGYGAMLAFLLFANWWGSR